MDVPAGRTVAAPAVAKVVKPAYITWLTLAFMTTASVASLRTAPTMAVYGLTCVFLYIVPAIIFLLPQALVAAELPSGWKGGVPADAQAELEARDRRGDRVMTVTGPAPTSATNKHTWLCELANGASFV